MLPTATGPEPVLLLMALSKLKLWAGGHSPLFFLMDGMNMKEFSINYWFTGASRIRLIAVYIIFFTSSSRLL